MKGINWLAFGLSLSLLLVSGVSVGSQFWTRSNKPSNFFVAQDLRLIKQLSSRALSQINQSFDSQFSALNNSATVVSTWNIISNWFHSVTGWLGGLWPKSTKAPVITPTEREQIRQEFLTELKSQGLIKSEILAGETAGTKYGIIVAPSTGSTTRDEWLKKSLSQMFADQVNVKFDQTGMSGVVTPTFQDGRQGGDYIFVLTPLR